MSNLLMLKGLPASGKSTYAKKLVDKGWVRVNKDDLRAMLNNSKWSKNNEKFVLKVRDFIVSDAISLGKNVVVDDTNFEEKHEEDLRKIANVYGANFEIKFFDTPLKTCLERDSSRPNPVGSKVINDMYKKYLRPQQEYIPPEGKPKAIICDIDGTLAEITDRSPYDYTKVKQDILKEPIASILEKFAGDLYTIILLSGREDSCRDDTLEWLADNGVDFDYLYMRKTGDDRNDAIIKKELFEAHVEKNFQVFFVLDDRNRVVDLWRSLGLTCFQVQEGDF